MGEHQARRGDTAAYERPPDPPRFAHARGRARVPDRPLRAADTGGLPPYQPQRPAPLEVTLPLRVEVLLVLCALILVALVPTVGWAAVRLWQLERAIETPIVVTPPTP